MSRTVTISTIQLKLVVHDGRSVADGMADNLARMLVHLHEAGKRGSDIALLPETFTHAGIRLDAATLERSAETLDSRVFREISDVAKQCRMHVVVPVYLKQEGKVYNSAVFVNRQGEVTDVYNKIHLTHPEMELGVQAGSEFRAVQLDFGRAGAIICHDNNFVESARCLALMGAEIVFWPHFQSGWGEVMWDVQLRSRAIDNGVVFVSAAYSDKTEQGNWLPGRVIGRSGIVGDDGVILADRGREPGVATAEVDLDDKRRAHCFCYADVVDYKKELFRHRMPDAYGALLRGSYAEAPEETD